MAASKSLFTTGLTALFFILLFLACILPEDPQDPSKTSVNIIMRSSVWNEQDSFLEDTAGNVIQIGVATFLSRNIDSISLKITEDDSTVFDTMFTLLGDGMNDTLWKRIVFYTAGERKVTIVPYSALSLNEISATISLVGKEFPFNAPPLLAIEGRRIIRPSETCSLQVKAQD